MEFSERISAILHGRKLYPWAQALNISSGIARRIGQNVIPGSEILTAICRTENVSLNWLLDGRGNPYLIDRCDSDEVLAEQLAHHFEDCAYKVHLIHDGSDLVIELSEKAQLEYKGKCVDYVEYEYLTGSLGEKTRKILLEQYKLDPNQWFDALLEPNSVQKLQKGVMGPFQLYGDDKIPGYLAPVWIETSGVLEKLLDNCTQFVRSLGEIDTQLMRAVITLVEETEMLEATTLSVDQRARIYTTAYRHAERKGLTARELDSSYILSLIEVIK
ncbi:hypothetical protein [Endozoicomonas sp. ALD040]|uniref:hypothetical protein n=1 Tax=Endozoicomonas sp. ALD040 TaxID=3403079 RepID=UPI003BAECA1C